MADRDSAADCNLRESDEMRTDAVTAPVLSLTIVCSGQQGAGMENTAGSQNNMEQ